jgi:hypothetical protein
MMRRYLEWIFAGMIILGISGQNTVFGQGGEQDPRPAVSRTSPAAKPGTKIPPPRVYQPRHDGAVKLASNAGVMPSPQFLTAPGPIGSSQLPSGQTLTPGIGPSGPLQFGPAPGAAPPFSGTATTTPNELTPEGAGPFGVYPGGTGTPPVGGAPGTPGAAGVGPGPAAPPITSALAAEGGLAGLAGEVGAGALANLTPAMIGDQSPYTLMKAIAVPPIPTPFPPPRPGVSPVTRTAKSIAGVVPAIRGFKIADNQSPRPTDRVFNSFNFFDNVNRALNERLGAPIQNMLVYRQVYGFEKTFFDGLASIGIREPINSMTIQANPRFGALGGTSSAFGNLNVFTKLILWENQAGSLISAGLAVDIPTGPNTFAGFPSTLGKNVTDIQPFLGYIFTNGGDWFVQGFGSVAVPTDGALPTMMFLDAALGYYIYRNNDPGSFLTAIVPTFETHVNIPLNHSSLNFNDTYGTPTVVDLTFGVNTQVCRRGILTLGYALPVTGPTPFSGEFILQFNWLFGGGRQRPATGVIPPVIGG